ncbi:MAG: amidase [Chloroflexia bacterium]|nr:amidase [Chloroflexia bacterium]
MTTDELCFLSAIELRAAYRQRDLSPVEVTEAILARIDRLNLALTAFITVTPEIALRHARDAERAYATGDGILPLSGVPISIKDLTPTKGIRTTRGSLLDPDWVPDEDAPFVERVYAAGAVMLGKTNTPELGWKGDSGNRLVGPTHNPWQHGRTAGGSSGGAGAAVAASLGPLAQGSDAAGSIRIPAAFCGIVGFKPSFGLIPQYPRSAVGDLSHLGPMTRTVADAALLFDVVAGADPRDRLSWSTDSSTLDSLDQGVHGLRVAWSPNLGYAPVDPAVLAVVESAASSFSGLGCEVDRVDPNLTNPSDIIDLLWSSAMAGYAFGRLDQIRDRLDPGLVRVMERGATISAAAYTDAETRRAAYFQGMRQFMERYDLLLTPTLPITAFAAGADQPESPATESDDHLDWTPFTYPFNLTGQPAISLPCGMVDGLPVGIQIVGRWHDDRRVLRAAAAFETMAPWRHLRPPLDG